MKKPAVLFVCLGNICRSPTAEAVFRHLLVEQQLTDSFVVDSAGTGDWHIGKPPHGPARQAAAARGVDMSALRARQVVPDDFDRFDYILAMDNLNLRDLQAMQPGGYQGHLGLFTDFNPEYRGSAIADPYGGAAADFDRAFEQIDQVTRTLLNQLVAKQVVAP